MVVTDILSGPFEEDLKSELSEAQLERLSFAEAIRDDSTKSTIETHNPSGGCGGFEFDPAYAFDYLNDNGLYRPRTDWLVRGLPNPVYPYSEMPKPNGRGLLDRPGYYGYPVESKQTAFQVEP